MAASDNQRKWNRFFECGSGASGPGRGQKRIRRAKTTCQNYEKSTESCRLNGDLCMAPGHCPDYARRPDLDEKPKIDRGKTGAETARKRSVPVTANGRDARDSGHAMAPSADWNPEKPHDWNFSPGQAVVHKYFGKGTVLTIKDDIMEVDFEQVGRKRLKASFFQKNPVMFIQR